MLLLDHVLLAHPDGENEGLDRGERPDLVLDALRDKAAEVVGVLSALLVLAAPDLDHLEIVDVLPDGERAVVVPDDLDGLGVLLVQTTAAGHRADRLQEVDLPVDVDDGEGLDRGEDGAEPLRIVFVHLLSGEGLVEVLHRDAGIRGLLLLLLAAPDHLVRLAEVEEELVVRLLVTLQRVEGRPGEDAEVLLAGDGELLAGLDVPDDEDELVVLLVDLDDLDGARRDEGEDAVLPGGRLLRVREAEPEGEVALLLVGEGRHLAHRAGFLLARREIHDRGGTELVGLAFERDLDRGARVEVVASGVVVDDLLHVEPPRFCRSLKFWNNYTL